MPKTSRSAIAGANEQRSGAVSRARWAAGGISGKPVYPKDDRGVVDRAAVIHKLIRDNPKRGSSARRFELYVDGMTVDDYIEAVQKAGFPERSALDDVLSDISRGFIATVHLPRGPWTVPEAKAKLSEILRLAREGKPQTIGAQDPCVVVSAADFERLQPVSHLGQFLIETAPRGAEIELPSRADHRGDPFAEE
jgi:prevent-host-death family protein